MKKNISVKDILVALGSAIGVILLIWGCIYVILHNHNSSGETYVDMVDANNPHPNQKEINAFYYWRAAAQGINNEQEKAKDSFFVHSIGGLPLANASSNIAYRYITYDTAGYYMMKKIPTRYVGLPWLRLKNENDFYFSENGKHFLLPTVTKKDTAGLLQTHPSKVEVNFAVKKDLSNGFSKNQFDKDQILIPSHHNQIWQIHALATNGLILIAYTILILYSVVIVWNISKGKPFSNANIVRLKICVLFSILPLLLTLLSVVVIYLLVYKDVTPYVSFDFSGINIGLTSVLTPTIYAFLSIAFARGYKLQQDQEFTI
ncbi:MAG: DUF2975 domain-containing protein [Chitinophagaceae bacterium]